MKLFIQNRITLYQFCDLFFDENIYNCITGKISSKNWYWQKYFDINMYGKFLLYMLLNGVFTKESEYEVFRFINKYKGRILEGIKFRKCFVDKVYEVGFSNALLYIYFVYYNRNLYLRNKPICCKLLWEFLPNYKPGKNISLFCKSAEYLLSIFSKLNDENYIKVTGLKDKDMCEILVGSKDIYSKVVGFNNFILLSSLLRVCISQRKINSTINRVRNKLKLLKPDLINEFNRYSKLLTFNEFKKQISEKECLEVCLNAINR